MSERVPEGWKEIILGDNLEILSGFPFKSSNFTSDFGSIGLIRIRDLIDQKIETFYEGDYEQTFLVSKGDILIGMDGDFNIVKWKVTPALLNQRICKINVAENKPFDMDFLYHVIAVELQLIQNRTGATTVKH